MIRLSFIVPFYNVEPYIEECIRSLYNQDIPKEEYEVICVDDCSPDGSRAIVVRLQKEYPTLRLLIHTENKRQGGARNTGLNVARGKYIWFVDSDDTIEQNCLKRLLGIAEEKNLDILKFYFNIDDRHENMHPSYSENVSTGSHLIFDVESKTPLIGRCCSAVKQLIRKDLLEKNSIVFAEHVQYEDDDFAYQIFAFADRAFLIPDMPYKVRRTPNSTTRRNNDLRRIHDFYEQAIRLVKIEPLLKQRDIRWAEMVRVCVDDSFNNLIFKMLIASSFSDQMHFWFIDRTHIRCFKPYLSRKSYSKLCSYIIWKILQ